MNRVLLGTLWAAFSAWPLAADAADWPAPPTQTLAAKPLAGLVAAVERGDYPKTTSVLIVHRGALAFEKYFGAGSADLLNDTRSATKSITALAVGASVADHAIASVEAPAFEYVRDLAPFAHDDPIKRGILVRDLLTMSSALECDDDRDESRGNEDRMHEQANWTRWIVDLPLKPDYRRDARGYGPFSYCTAGAVLLGQIVQRATHTAIDRYIETRIFQPLGITQWQWPQSPAGEIMTGGGLRLRSRDLAKIAWMMTDGGTWQKQQVVPAAWIASTMTPATKANPEQSYGYLLWQRTQTTACGALDTWYMAGNGGSAIVVVKQLQAAIVVTRQNYNTRGMHQQTADLLQRYILPAIPCG